MRILINKQNNDKFKLKKLFLFHDHVIRNVRNFSDEKGHELKVVHDMLKMSHCVIFLL